MNDYPTPTYSEKSPVEEYNKLVAEMLTGPSTERRMEIWQRIEEIKNKNGGKVPK